MHYINTAITVAFVLVSILIFPSAFVRIGESFRDLWTSIVFYFRELTGLNINVTPTVNEYSSVPMTPILGLPGTWEEFQVMWSNYWSFWATWSNVQAYFGSLSDGLYNFAKIVLLVVVPLLLVLIVLFQRYLRKENNDYNKDSKVLRGFKWFALKVYSPVKNWILSYIGFTKEHSKYYKMWLFIWFFNFNIITIIIEFLAFYLYFVISFDFINLYRQFYKLFCDLSVIIAFIPLPVWIIAGLIIFDKIRRHIGYKTLYHLEAKDCGFINSLPIVVMGVGSMGKKKTTLITDMQLSQEVIFRDKALEKILENDLKFPDFPWINLENSLKIAIETHTVFNLATTRLFIRKKQHIFNAYLNDKAIHKSINRYLKKKYGAINDNHLIFDYDYKRYGVTYDDKLKVIDIWKTIEDYAQLYFIYILQSSLLVTNYSVRVDAIKEDLGNFPLWNDDFFKRDSRLIDVFSRHSNIIDFDFLRLGSKLVADNPRKDMFEFAILGITEIGKERKNNLELQGTKKKDEGTNQKNDGFNDWLKMVRHSATVDNYPFVKVFCDEQRPESWGADARDLCEIVHIVEADNVSLSMPFFFIEELLFDFIFNRFTNLYYQYRFNRADNTLFMYLVKKVCGALHNYYKRTYNTFGYCKVLIDLEEGTQDSSRIRKNYYLMNKKIYSDRFRTDCFNDFFTTKVLRSEIGLNDLPKFAGKNATLEEMQEFGSYFVNGMVDKFLNDK